MEKESDNKSNFPEVRYSSSSHGGGFLFVHLSCMATYRANRYSGHAYCFGAILLRLALPVRLVHGRDYSNPEGL
jgi:hypothetical protein